VDHQSRDRSCERARQLGSNNGEEPLLGNAWFHWFQKNGLSYRLEPVESPLAVKSADVFHVKCCSACSAPRRSHGARTFALNSKMDGWFDTESTW
jgi:hypothetical protein